MDVLAQALNVAEQAEAATGTVTLTFDMSDLHHRAACAAAIAVLRISGVDEDTLMSKEDRPAVPQQLVDAHGEPFPESTELQDEQNAMLLKSYVEAMVDLTPDEQRRNQIARETFPRIVELLRDGANIEAVAQIQYRRWLEEHLGSVHSG